MFLILFKNIRKVVQSAYRGVCARIDHERLLARRLSLRTALAKLVTLISIYFDFAIHSPFVQVQSNARAMFARIEFEVAYRARLELRTDCAIVVQVYMLFFCHEFFWARNNKQMRISVLCEGCLHDRRSKARNSLVVDSLR